MKLVINSLCGRVHFIGFFYVALTARPQTAAKWFSAISLLSISRICTEKANCHKKHNYSWVCPRSAAFPYHCLRSGHLQTQETVCPWVDFVPCPDAKAPKPEILSPVDRANKPTFGLISLQCCSKAAPESLATLQSFFGVWGPDHEMKVTIRHDESEMMMKMKWTVT